MPYVIESIRELLDRGSPPVTSGDLNYLFTSIILEYLGPGHNYQAFNDCIGALECCKLELYRRMVAPYEDNKIEENGDVFY